MKFSFFIFYWIGFFAVSCNNLERQAKTTADTAKLHAQSIDHVSRYDKEGNTHIFTDSIYPGKYYKILISNFSEDKSYDEAVYNSIFQFFELKNGYYKETYKDSIQRHFDGVLFEDFTNDGIPDLLIENISDVRSNSTYNLYKVDTLNSKLTRIKGFENIKNPHFLPKYNLIENMVMSGRNYTNFYGIEDDSIVDYGITIYDGEDEVGNYTYDVDYEKALNKILHSKTVKN